MVVGTKSQLHTITLIKFMCDIIDLDNLIVFVTNCSIISKTTREAPSVWSWVEVAPL